MCCFDGANIVSFPPTPTPSSLKNRYLGCGCMLTHTHTHTQKQTKISFAYTEFLMSNPLFMLVPLYPRMYIICLQTLSLTSSVLFFIMTRDRFNSDWDKGGIGTGFLFIFSLLFSLSLSPSLPPSLPPSTLTGTKVEYWWYTYLSTFLPLLFSHSCS